MPTRPRSSAWPVSTSSAAGEQRARRHGLRHQVGRDLALPRRGMLRGVRGPGDHLAEVTALRCAGPSRPVRPGGVAGPGVGPDHAVGRDGRPQRIEGGLVGTLVEDLRPGALLRRPDRRVVAGQRHRDAGGRVVEVAGHDRLRRADDDAARLEPVLHPVGAEVALVRGRRLRVQVDGVVRAGVHARLAADAHRVVEVDDAVVPPEERRRRADRDAGGVVAVVAAQHRVEAPGVGERPLLDVLHPRPVDPEGDVVLGLAGHGAGVAADAGVLVDQEAESGHAGRPCTGPFHPCGNGARQAGRQGIRRGPRPA